MTIIGSELLRVRAESGEGASFEAMVGKLVVE
jgi:hypothetical protein